MKQLKVASFFAGIGGFDLGFERAGFQVNFQCEIEPFCESVLNFHWPNISVSKDIATLSAETIPSADVWCGGFPCQDLSVARGSNGRHGLSGTRSGLFFKLAELAVKKRPKVILIENVHGLLNSNNGKDFAELLHTLGNMGYAVSWRLLNSRYFGVPQSRPRVYICAWLHNPIAAGNVLFEDRAPCPAANERAAFLATSWTGGQGPIAPKLAFCLAATSGRHTGTDWSRTYISYFDAVRRLTPLECERLQGFPDGWTALATTALDAERSDSLRYHALGNAVSVAVVEWIARRIGQQFSAGLGDARKPRKDVSIFAEAIQRWPGLTNPSLVSEELSAVRNDSAKTIWPTAGILWDGAFVAGRVAPSLNKPASSDLSTLIEPHRPDSRYFLSPNAAEGILRRVDSQDRHLFPPLRQALERMSGRVACEAPKIQRTRQPELFLAETECVSP
jgi:DNA (cytosine-5)-methyltransferase 1